MSLIISAISEDVTLSVPGKFEGEFSKILFKFPILSSSILWAENWPLLVPESEIRLYSAIVNMETSSVRNENNLLRASLKSQWLGKIDQASTSSCKKKEKNGTPGKDLWQSLPNFEQQFNSKECGKFWVLW